MVSGKIRKRSNHKHRSTRCFFFFFFLSHLLSYFERFLTGKRSTLSFGKSSIWLLLGEFYGFFFLGIAGDIVLIINGRKKKDSVSSEKR
ncbi:hypothetical protein MRB53_018574 [Persea americana]|uniref:Uncharacterized protein n=1 Tax=Persea americana TaxID=3435 RepID=A0ACC2M8B6_PERAE|nr:hypothetical protein MRB53_018574 [Persea americana]